MESNPGVDIKRVAQALGEAQLTIMVLQAEVERLAGELQAIRAKLVEEVEP